MTSVDYCSKVIKVVAELMEVREEDIYGRTRTFDAVDARWIVIQLLRDQKMSTKKIALLLSHPERTINHALSMVESRAKFSTNGFGNTLSIARKILGNKPYREQ
jgi:chromosomal replication initiation ATPase DnaA